MSIDFSPQDHNRDHNPEQLAVIRRRTMEIRIKNALENEKVDTSTASQRLEDHVFDDTGSFFAPLAEQTLRQVQHAEQRPASDFADVERTVLWQQFNIAHAASELAADCLPLLRDGVSSEEKATEQERLLSQLEDNHLLSLEVKNAFRSIIEQPGPDSRRTIGATALKDL